ncbi:MAG: transposase [Candidatus Paceibacterota bacterium]|jgi:putative transposase
MTEDIYHHIYNRGAHKEPIFREGSDYMRMLKLFYIANNKESFTISSFGLTNIFEAKRKCLLVDIVAYCLMPNHIHLALKELEPFGISRFIHSLATGYSGYFNRKYGHSGTIWQGPYNEKPVCDEMYIRKLINYIHLNPYGIKEPEMSKEARAEHLDEAVAYSETYEFSSFRDYLGIERVQKAILSVTEVGKFLEA